MRVIEFVPPITGIGGDFNTFRLGTFYFKRLIVGDRVALVDSKERLIVGFAVVTYLEMGKLADMLQLYAYMNHTQIANVGEVSRERALMAVMQRLYGPHVATPTKNTTVIGLRRVNDPSAAGT